uniref:Ribbon-helix-helix protein, CopG family n=1 Tax=Candidatus Desulfatibia profunda TaxID=2841695 RepID=A0A8J6TID8_9BACT|nr:ribbon-helix-helix protein, CopG family [Candidatus Desulfatibia profunda]
MLQKSITFSARPELIEIIDRLAQKERRSRSQMIVILLEKAVNTED